MREAELMALIAKANERYQALSPQEKEEHDYEQRRSFVRGSCPSDRNYEDWCKVVDKLMPPRRR